MSGRDVEEQAEAVIEEDTGGEKWCTDTEEDKDTDEVPDSDLEVLRPPGHILAEEEAGCRAAVTRD